MSVHTVTDVREPTTGSPELGHIYCCDEDVALCGTDVSTAHICPDDGSCGCVMCVVCGDLDEYDCPRCGE